MKYNIDLESSIANTGNLYRLKKVLKRAQIGDKLTIGFIGGSITQGSLSSTPETCYAYRVYSWWKQKFPMTSFSYLNAGIGGTTSQFGAARVGADLLAYEPDFVIVEFSVNDDDNVHFQETYEGLIRTILYSTMEPAVLIVNSVYNNDGRNAQKQHNTVGKAYQLPCISMKNAVYPLVEAGEIKSNEITPDNLHPNDNGHELVADIITGFLEKVYQEIEQEDVPVENPIAPITRNTYENSVRYQNYSSNYSVDGFYADKSVQESITQFFKNGWTADRTGASIVFEVEGTGIAIQYRKSVSKPTPVALAIVDDDEENGVLLDGNFEEDWGDCLYLQTLTEYMERKKHKVEVRIIKTHEKDVVPFYLVSVIGAN